MNVRGLQIFLRNCRTAPQSEDTIALSEARCTTNAGTAKIALFPLQNPGRHLPASNRYKQFDQASFSLQPNHAHSGTDASSAKHRSSVALFSSASILCVITPVLKSAAVPRRPCHFKRHMPHSISHDPFEQDSSSFAILFHPFALLFDSCPHLVYTGGISCL